MQAIQRRRKLDVFVVENHDEVVPCIHSSIRRKLLPFGKNTLVHFDSHPDLCIPNDMPAEIVFSKQQLYEQLSIENWLMPLVYAGHICHIIWIKPAWAQQIPLGCHAMLIGKDIVTGNIRCTSKLEYFFSELVYCSEDNMTDTQQLTLFVVEFEDFVKAVGCNCSNLSPSIIGADQISTKGSFLSDNSNAHDDSLNFHSCKSKIADQHALHAPCSSVAHKIALFDEPELCEHCKIKPVSHVPASTCALHQKSLLTTCSKCCWNQILLLLIKGYILDIDLDFFSTMDPFRVQFTKDQYDALKLVYKFECPKSSLEEEFQTCLQKRQQQISELKIFCTELSEGKRPYISKDSHIAALEKVFPRETDWLFVHEVGTGIDSTDLPHHVSTEEEIQIMIDQLKQCLKSLPQPHCITIARSSEDDYCPSDQVNDIQEAVLEVINEVYKQSSVNIVPPGLILNN